MPTKPRVIGIIPARMKASRFPGKPLHPILGKAMIEHVYLRGNMYEGWDHYAFATCDIEIEDYCKERSWQVVMTSDQHTRCLDRIAEAAPKVCPQIEDNDIVVCVQGDEPLLYPDMMEAVVKPCLEDPNVPCTVLGMDIVSETEFHNPDVVKIIHDLKGDVLYTSRAPVPYTKEFSKDSGAIRIYGIFAFRWSFLKTYTSLPESPLEIAESCDSNRICDNGYKQRVAPYPYRDSFAVDHPQDVAKVEAALEKDSLWGKY